MASTLGPIPHDYQVQYLTLLLQYAPYLVRRPTLLVHSWLHSWYTPGTLLVHWYWYYSVVNIYLRLYLTVLRFITFTYIYGRAIIT